MDLYTNAKSSQSLQNSQQNSKNEKSKIIQFSTGINTSTHISKKGKSKQEQMMMNQKEAKKVTMDQKQITTQPYDYLLNNTKGKGFRPKLIDAFNKWLQLDVDNVKVIKSITQKLHNASLLIDDIEDNSKLRRGRPCAHLIYGVPLTINSANYVYFEALKDCQKLENIEVIRVFMDELLLLHEGQAMDIYWRDNCVCPTEEQYIQMVQNKTGGLFRLSICMMKSLSISQTSKKQEGTESEEVKQACNIDYVPLVNKLATLFQIMDDFLNLQSPIYHQNKSFCEDLTEGKFSFPIIHSIQSNPNDMRLLSIVRQRATDYEIKKYALECMKETESFEYTMQRIRKMESQVLKDIQSIEEKTGIKNDQLKQIVSMILNEIKEPKSEK